MENLIHGVFHPDRYTGTYSLTGNPGLKFCLKQLKAPDPQPDRVHFHKFRQAASGQKAVHRQSCRSDQYSGFHICCWQKADIKVRLMVSASWFSFVKNICTHYSTMYKCVNSIISKCIFVFFDIQRGDALY